VIQKTLGEKVRLVNSAQETAKEAKRLMSKLKIAQTAARKSPDLRFYVSDEPEQFRTLGERFLGTSIQSVAKVDEQYRQPGFDRRAKVNGRAGALQGMLEGPFISKAGV